MREEIEAAFELEFPGLLFMDGLDDAIIGMSEREAPSSCVFHHENTTKPR